MRIALGNHKGGSGKTTSTMQLAARLALLGVRTLVVDMDPQANATRRAAVTGRQTALTTTAEVVRSGETGCAADAVVPTGWDVDYASNVRLIPARFDLENRISEAAVVGAAGRLRRALSGVDDDDFDVTLIDCPPSLGHLTQLVLAAVDQVLVTVEPEYDSVDGAVRLRDFISTAAAELGNPDLSILGYLVTRVRSQLGAHQFQVDGLDELFGDQVWTPHIPEWAAIKEASEYAVPLSEITTGKAREAATIYEQLAQRVQEATKNA